MTSALYIAGCAAFSKCLIHICCFVDQQRSTNVPLTFEGIGRQQGSLDEKYMYAMHTIHKRDDNGIPKQLYVFDPHTSALSRQFQASKGVLEPCLRTCTLFQWIAILPDMEETRRLRRSIEIGIVISRNEMYQFTICICPSQYLHS